MKAILIYLALCFFSLSFSQAQVQKNNFIEKFKQEKKVSDLLINKKGTPTFIQGNLSPKNSETSGLKSANVKEDAVTKTFRFFEENRELFNMKEPDRELMITKTEVDELGMTHVRMSQNYQGVEVYGAELIAHYMPTGELNVINGEYQADINVSVTPKVTSDEAESIVLSNLSIKGYKPESLNSKLIIYQFDEVYYLSWFVQLYVERPAGRWEYFINATNGEVIYCANRMMFNQNKGENEAKSNIPFRIGIGTNQNVNANNSLKKSVVRFTASSINNDSIQYREMHSGSVTQKKGIQSLLKSQNVKFFQSNEVEESLTNNLKSSAMALPNLFVYTDSGSIVNYIWHEKSNLLDLYASIANEGLGTTEGFRIGFYLSTNTSISTSDYLIAYANINSLSGGEIVEIDGEVNLNDFNNLPKGSYYLGIFCDDQSQVTESDETDNKVYFIQPISYYPGNYSDAVGTGTGVMGDTKNHIDTYGQTGSYLLLDRTRRANNNIHNHNGQMLNDQSIETRAYSNLSTYNDDNNLWNSNSQASSVDAHVYAGLVYDYLLAQFGRNSFDNKGSGMLSIVDDNSNGKDWANNAYWDGTKVNYTIVTIGNRSNSGALDVVGHEWGHAVTQCSSKLEYEKESGALNESFSDMLGIAIGFSTGIDPDWQIGENSYTDGHADRDLSNPHLHRQPDTYLSDFYWEDIVGCTTPSEDNDYCGVHTNSGVPNKMFYLLSQGGTQNGITVNGIGISNAIKIMYRANSNYWNQFTDFINAKQGCISAANDLDKTGDWAIQTRKAWEAVNVGKPILPEASLALGTINGSTGNAVSIPVTASKFSDIAEFQFTIVYDNTKLDFVSCSNWSGGINESDVKVASFPNEGKITFGYNNSAINIDNGKFFELNFKIKAIATETIPLSWSNVSPIKDSRNKEIPCKYINGLVNNDIALSNVYNKIEIKAFPIPANNQLTVTNVENSRISVIDLFGRSVISVESYSNSIKLDLTNLQTGKYILKINKNKEIISRKFSVVK